MTIERALLLCIAVGMPLLFALGVWSMRSLIKTVESILDRNAARNTASLESFSKALRLLVVAVVRGPRSRTRAVKRAG